MSRCLSDRALTRVLAELGTDDERAHLAVCELCAARYRRIQGDVARIAHAIATAPAAILRTRTRPTRRWLAAAAILVALVGGLWLWRGAGSGPPAVSARDPRVATAMADITTVLFSVDGEPRPRTVALEPEATREAECVGFAPSAGMYCPSGALDLNEGTDALEVDNYQQSRRLAEGRDGERDQQ